MITRAAIKNPASRLLLLVAALALLITAVSYFPSASSHSAAQIRTSVAAPTVVASAAKVDPLLVSVLNSRGAGAAVPVVIAYNSAPKSSELGRLQAVGIKKGFALRELPMVIAPMNAAQLAAVKTQPGVRSVSANRIMKIFTNESRRFIGVPQMMADGDVTRANQQNPGIPISGKGIGIGYIDTGIDATHADLQYGSKVVQNVIQPISETTVGDGGLAVGVGINIFDNIYEATGFYAPVYLEDQHHSDLESGHGTHGSAVAAGTGAASGTFYGGVAQGAHLIGVNSGNELGLPLVSILGAYDYLLVNQFRYNVRVINNSWGSMLDDFGIDPANPINVATRAAHDRNIVVVFAAGNDGDVANAINPYSTVPWTISVAAGEKRGLGTPAGFSSRGENNGDGVDVAGQPADETARPNLRPDITAPGVDIKSARMKGAGITNTAGSIPIFVGANDLSTIPPAYLPFYTTSQGTSFACPHISGVVALMLEAKPTLTPDEVVTILRETANPMPYEERVVGAGYVDAHNAVRRVLGLGAIAHPYNLFPQPGGPEIVDPEGDQILGSGINAAGATDAQDILSADYAYDAARREIVYTLTVKGLALRQIGNSWLMSSDFDGTTLYVTATTTLTGTVVYSYGKITPPAAGTGPREQTDIADLTTGEIRGNQIIIRLPVDELKKPESLGKDVVGKTSTATEALAQVGVGLLFASDIANGADFKVE
ncbi:MAG TPA: S8 family serine peptidase [Pyrinomonadaceae bacterium]|jgi:serine protease AprX|nr:S8 family serine peptidase [Pyrinomonadaceae bacterium]